MCRDCRRNIECWGSMRWIFINHNLSPCSLPHLSLPNPPHLILINPFALLYLRDSPDQVEGVWMEGGSRTLESLVTNQEKYEKEGHGDRSRLRQFYNSEFQVIALSPHVMIFPVLWLTDLLQPLIRPHPAADTPTKVLHRMPPPPLHCVRLGPKNYLISALLELWPDLQVDGMYF